MPQVINTEFDAQFLIEIEEKFDSENETLDGDEQKDLFLFVPLSNLYKKEFSEHQLFITQKVFLTLKQNILGTKIANHFLVEFFVQGIT